MKVYSKIVIDMKSNTTVYEESFDYVGPVALCGGGSGGSEDTIDYEYNARMAGVAESQQGLSAEMMNIYKYGVPYDPTEKVLKPGAKPSRAGRYVTGPSKTERRMVGGRDGEMQDVTVPGERKWVPAYHNEDSYTTAGELNGYDDDAITSQLELELLGNQAKAELLPYDTENRKAGLIAQTRGIRERSDLMSGIYKDALNGVDVDKRVSESRAGVQHAFKNSMGIRNRNLSRMGIDPNSGRGLSMAQGMENTRAKALASGEANVRRGAEEENFKRKTAAAGLPI